MLIILRRNLKHCPHKLKETAYFALECSVLDYACPIWDPFLMDILEKVQRKAARFVCGDHRTTSIVTTMLSTLGWNQLEKRQRDVRLALLFKVVHGQVEVTTDDLYLTKADSRTRANHPYKYHVKGADTKELQNCFTHRTISDWNNLPASIVAADSTDAFKVCLARHTPKLD